MDITFRCEHLSLSGRLDSTISYTIYKESSLPDIVHDFRLFLLAIGFQDESISNYINKEE